MKLPAVSARFAFMLAIGMSLASCGDVRDELPEKIAVREVMASSASGFFMERCASAVYRLSDETVAALRQQGADFFRGIGSPRNQNPGNPYAEWRETPLPDPRENHILAVFAIGGCEEQADDFRAHEIEEALRTPGSFYALASNREGMIVVAPKARIAAFLYFG